MVQLSKNKNTFIYIYRENYRTKQKDTQKASGQAEVPVGHPAGHSFVGHRQHSE